MKLAIVASIATVVLASACTPQEKTVTVPELLQNPALLEKIATWCRVSPGERQTMPNCINAREALQQAKVECSKQNFGKAPTYPLRNGARC